MASNEITINPTFYYGSIISYSFLGGITKDKGKYRYRFELVFKSGDTYKTQKSGFTSMKEAKISQELLIAKLATNMYCPFNYTLKEYLDYWLYEHMKNDVRIRYNTFDSYYNVLYNYLIPSIGPNKSICNITPADLVKAVDKIKYKTVRGRAIELLTTIFKYAFERHYIDYNPSIAAVQTLKKKHPPAKKSRVRNVKPYAIPEIRNLLFTCKMEFSDMYIPLLLTFTAGTRISETIGLKYSDIDFRHNLIYVERQLGRDFDPEYEANDSPLLTKELETKTPNGVRAVPLADWVVHELLLKKAWYESQKERLSDFKDTGYICCHCDGRPFHRKSFAENFKKLLTMCGLQIIHWHDIRHMYSSILKNNSVNMKAISIYMGHSNPEFTDEIYTYHEETAYDCSSISEVWEEIRPKQDSELSSDSPSDGFSIPFEGDFMKEFLK